MLILVKLTLWFHSLLWQADRNTPRWWLLLHSSSFLRSAFPSGDVCQIRIKSNRDSKFLLWALKSYKKCRRRDTALLQNIIVFCGLADCFSNIGQARILCSNYTVYLVQKRKNINLLKFKTPTYIFKMWCCDMIMLLLFKIKIKLIIYLDSHVI